MTQRWEWRVFGVESRNLDARLRASTLPTVSDERYVLSDYSRATVSVAHGMLNVETLEQVNGDRLQQWRPVLMAPFPVGAAAVLAVMRHLGVPLPELLRSRYTAEQWLNEVVSHIPGVTAVRVKKAQYSATVDECLVEVVDALVDGRPITTMAVTGGSAIRVMEVVRSLGLHGATEDYVTAFKRLSMPVPVLAMAGPHPRRTDEDPLRCDI